QLLKRPTRQVRVDPEPQLSHNAGGSLESRMMFVPVSWPLAHGRTIELRRKAVVMGVLNVTPDSFSDGGRYVPLDAALQQARRMVEEGASIIDIGGESTRPGGATVDAAEEQRRVLPLVEALAEEGGLLISV